MDSENHDSICLSISATCFKNGRAFDESIKTFLKAADMQIETKSYPCTNCSEHYFFEINLQDFVENRENIAVKL